MTHEYLSTACLHGEHDYCRSMTGYQGAKRPAQCKWCEARCICRCHQRDERNRMSALEAVDAESEAVRTGFRITLDYMKTRVASHENIERGVLNICVIQMDNGFWLVGKSAPVDPGNYNAEYGRQLAYDDALRQAWPLYAFAHLEKNGES